MDINERIQYVVDNAGKVCIADMVKHLGVSRGSIIQIAAKRKISLAVETEESKIYKYRCEFIRNNALKMDNNKIAEELGIPMRKLYCIASRIGVPLSKKNYPERTVDDFVHSELIVQRQNVLSMRWI